MATSTEERKIVWTEKKIALLKTLSDLKATSGTSAATVEEVVKASGGKALSNVHPHFDMTTQGYLAWSQLEGERVHRIYLTKKGQGQLVRLLKNDK